MKNVFLTVALLLGLTVATNAQTEKGRFLLSGSSDMSILFGKTKVRYDGKEYGNSSTTNFNITPTIQYFFIDNLAIGAALNVSYQDDNNSDATSFFIGPTARYYFSGEKLKPFAEALIGIGTNKWGSAKYSQFNFGLGGGASYFITENFSFDASLGYLHTGLTDRDDTKRKINSNTFGLNVGVSVFF